MIRVVKYVHNIRTITLGLPRLFKEYVYHYTNILYMQSATSDLRINALKAVL
jgi:hypothetical protein